MSSTNSRNSLCMFVVMSLIYIIGKGQVQELSLGGHQMLCHNIWNNGLLLLLAVFCCVEMIQIIPANFLSLHNTPVCLEVEHVQPCQRPSLGEV